MRTLYIVAFLGLIACKGSVSPSGKTGPTGPDGPQGPQGPNGNPGPPGLVVARYSASQTISNTPLVTQGPGNWLDIPGVVMNFNMDHSAAVDALAHGGMNGMSSSLGIAGCSLRYVVDGAPTGDPTWGDRFIHVGPQVFYSFTVTQRLPLPAGAHSIKLQLVRNLGPAPGPNVQECEIYATPSTLVWMFVTAH